MHGRNSKKILCETSNLKKKPATKKKWQQRCHNLWNRFMCSICAPSSVEYNFLDRPSIYFRVDLQPNKTKEIQIKCGSMGSIAAVGWILSRNAGRWFHVSSGSRTRGGEASPLASLLAPLECMMDISAETPRDRLMVCYMYMTCKMATFVCWQDCLCKVITHHVLSVELLTCFLSLI
jgi:hypothetical protein